MSGLEFLDFLVALGIGLLVGVERERNKGEGPEREAAGLRTFAVVSLLGAVAQRLGGLALPAAAVAIAVFCAASVLSRRGDDPGLTTEAALLLTLLLGALCGSEPALAAALGVTLAVLLAGKSRLHHFVRTVITEREVDDALVLAAATLVILPLVPDRYMGPLQAINPRAAWTLVVLILLAGAAGHVANRMFGARWGLPLSGLASGFASSVATMAAMGARARREAGLLRPAAAAAMFSTVATFVQLALVLAVVSPAVLREAGGPITAGLLVCLAYAAACALRSGAPADVRAETHAPGRAVSLRAALSLSLLLSGVLLLSALLQSRLGHGGAVAAALLSGFADAHAAAASVASLAAAGHMGAADAVPPVLAALTTNTVTKLLSARMAGGGRFALLVAPGLMMSLAAAWAAWLL